MLKILLSENFQLIVITLCLSILYFFYYKKYRYYIFRQKDEAPNPNKPRGKCPPFYPNGWYRLLNSDELKINDVKHFDYCGRNVVIFRGTNSKVYGLDAFCSHMGANLGKGGVVKNKSCIQCPFHGWVFDGETGNCVVSSDNITPKNVDQFEYHDIKESKQVDGKYLYKCYTGNINLKKYNIREVNGTILIWYDSREEFQDNIPYEPFDLNVKLDYRGESINFVNCHIQEIPENGADIRHFDFLHTNLFTFTSLVKFEWKMISHRASEDDLYEVMKHKYDFINEFKMKTLKKYINDSNKQYINVISLDSYVKIFGWKFFLFNATGFQLGPALVYLFLKSKLFEVTFAQSITPLKKFNIRVTHRIFTSSYLPYFVSAFMLYSEVQQLFSDMLIWNNKIFGSKLTYNLKTEADKNLVSWRNWYARFYEGCHEFEKKQEALDW